MEGAHSKPWHGMEAAQVLSDLSSDPARGLAEEEAGRRRAAFGPNELTRTKNTSAVLRFLQQFNQPLVIILLAASLITLVLGEFVDSAVILAVVLVNSTISFIQESKALKAIEALSRSMVSEAWVIRGGERRRIDSRDLVVGDLVALQSGDKVPADLRLVALKEMQIDESMLTGESVPSQKNSEPVKPEAGVGDRRCMAYSSTLVTYGGGRGVVVATGDATEIGRINDLISGADILETPLTLKIHHFSKILLVVILGMAGLAFAIGYIRGQDAVEIFMASVALAVGAIPEGLPAAITITLAIGVSRMARRRAIIRRLPAVETLGSTMIICSDKTGTLTQNQMTVLEIVAGGRAYALSGSGYSPEGRIEDADGPADVAAGSALGEILKAGMLCNDSRLKQTPEGWRVEGDPTEGALIAAAMKGGFDPGLLEKGMPRIDAIPFESERQYMATLHDQGEGRPRVIYMKGSIESVCVECEKMFGPDGSSCAPDRDRTSGWIDSMAAKGMRVLAFARKEVEPDRMSITHEDVRQGLVFLGLQGMIDPPRPEAIEAVRACQDAGVRVKMITGDHAATAAAIARQMGLCSEGCSHHTREVLTGREIGKLGDAEIVEQADRTAVFARVSPEQKLRLVEALQKKDYVVAMTGDGVNDAPALRQANIGVAMGVTGTEVAKESADMILTDDNFATIEAAVEEGRGVFDNLVKFITWTLPTNAGEGLVILAAIVVGSSLPILPLQILWINMTTALLLGLTLAFEPREPGIMSRPPRNPKMPILTRPLIGRILSVSVLLVAGAFGLFSIETLLRSGDVNLARTMAVNVFVFGEMFYLFNCRSLSEPFWKLGLFSNPLLWAGVAVMTALQLLFTYLPLFNGVFHTRPMGAAEWAMVLANSLAIFVAIEAEKLAGRIRARQRPRSPAPA